jgi:hypothetical protein
MMEYWKNGIRIGCQSLETFEKRPFLPNSPVEDAAGGEADKFLRLPREMPAQLNLHLIFNRGEAYFSGVMLKFQSLKYSMYS